MPTRAKQPKAKTCPESGKQPRALYNPDSHNHETIVWRFSVVDQCGPWGWRTEAARSWWGEILPKLQNYESMTWAEIMQAAGGKSKGNNSHPVRVEKLTPKAKQRLKDIDQDDVSELFSLRLSSRTRVYGIRDGRVLKLLWYDKYHGVNASAVYPVRSR